MGAVDDRLLELLDSEGPKSPGKIADHPKIRYSRPYLNERLIKLRKSELVEMVGNGVYTITPKGREYLSGDADLRDEEKPD